MKKQTNEWSLNTAKKIHFDGFASQKTLIPCGNHVPVTKPCNHLFLTGTLCKQTLPGNHHKNGARNQKSDISILNALTSIFSVALLIGAASTEDCCYKFNWDKVVFFIIMDMAELWKVIVFWMVLVLPVIRNMKHAQIRLCLMQAQYPGINKYINMYLYCNLVY